jgi:septal ring factor EnvC (AmiA/AmiB activator)
MADTDPQATLNGIFAKIKQSISNITKDSTYLSQVNDQLKAHKARGVKVDNAIADVSTQQQNLVTQLSSLLKELDSVTAKFNELDLQIANT